MDQFYCRGLKGIINNLIKDDAFTNNINEEYLGRIEKMKQDHRMVLTQFRSDFEESYKREQHVKTELKSKVHMSLIIIERSLETVREHQLNLQHYIKQRGYGISRKRKMKLIILFT